MSSPYAFYTKGGNSRYLRILIISSKGYMIRENDVFLSVICDRFDQSNIEIYPFDLFICIAINHVHD